MADLDITLEVRPEGVVSGARELAQATKQLSGATREQGAASRSTATEEERLARVQRQQQSAAGEMIRSYKLRIQALAEYQRSLRAGMSLETAAARSAVTGGGVNASGRQGQIASKFIQLEHEMKQAIAQRAEEQRRAEQVMANLAAMRERTRLMQEAVAAARNGEEAERAYAAAQEVRRQVEATGARPGTDQAAEAEREAVAQQRLQAELSEIASARERAKAAAASQAAEQQRLRASYESEESSLRESIQQLQIRIGAMGRGAAAEREANIQLQVRAALLRAATQAGTAEAATIERLVREQARLREQLDRVDASQRKTTGSAFSLRNAFFALQGVLATLGIVALVRSSVDLVTQFERSERSLTVVMGSASAAKDELGFLRQESDRLGVSFHETAITYSQFIAASKGSLELEQARDVFLTVTQALSQLGAPAEQTQRALLALQQMASKGTVSMEELRQQLGEALPGALQLAARGMGVSVQKFGQMVESGQVLAKDLLPKLSAEIKKAFDVDLSRRIEGTRQSLERMANGVEQLKASFGRGFLEGFAGGFSGLSRALGDRELARQAQEIGEAIGKALGVAAEAVLFLIRSVDGLKATLAAFLALRAGAKILELASAFRAAGGAAQFFAQSVNQAYLRLGPLAIAIGAVTWAISAYRREQAQNDAEELRRANQREDLTAYLRDLRSRTEQLTDAEVRLNTQRRQALELERTEARATLARARAEAARGVFFSDPEQARAAVEENQRVRDAKARVDELTGSILQLIRTTAGLSGLPKAADALGPPEELDKLGKKIAEVAAKYREQAEIAEKLLKFQAIREPAVRNELIARLEAHAQALEAVRSIEGLEGAAKQKLIGQIEAYILREREAAEAAGALVRARERQIEVDRQYREALAVLTDARLGDTEASRALAVQLEAERIAREDNREGDVAYIETLRAQLSEEARVLRSIGLVTAAVIRDREAKEASRQLTAQLADAGTGLETATAAVNLQLEISNALRTEGLKIGSAEADQRAAEIIGRRATEQSIRAEIATRERWSAVRREQAQIRAEIADWQAQGAAVRAYGSDLAGIIERTGRLTRATRELELRERILAAVRAEQANGPVAPARLAQIEAEIRAQDAAIQGVKDYRAELEIAAYRMQPVIEAWQATKATIADVVTDLVSGVEVDWKQLLQRMLQMWVRTLIEMVARARAAKLASTALGSTGGGGGGVGSGFEVGQQAVGLYSSAAGAGAGGSGAFLGVSSATWASFAAGFGIVAAGYFIAKMRSDAKEARRFDSGASLSASSQLGFQIGSGGKLTETARKIQEGMAGIIAALQDAGGIWIDSVANVSVRIRNDKKSFQAFFDNELVGTFRTANEAIIAAMRKGLLEADYASALDPAIRQVIEGAGRFQTPEEFAAAIRSVQALTDAAAGLSNLEKEMRALPVTLGRMRQELRAAGLSFEEVTRITHENALRLFQGWRDQITGRQQTEAERAAQQQREAALFNAQKALYEAQTQAELAQVNARIALTERIINIGVLQIDAEREFVNARGRLAQAEMGIQAAQIGAMGANVDAQLEILKKQRDALQAVLANLPQDIDLSTLKPPGSGRGGGGGRRQAAEDFADSLREIIDSTRPENIQRVRSMAERIREIQENARRFGTDAKLVAAAIELLRQQERARYQEIFDQATSQRSLTGFAEQLAALRSKYDDLRAANEESLVLTGELLIARWKLNAAEEAELRTLGRAAIDRLNAVGGTDPILAQIRETVELIRFLNDNLKDLGLTEQELLDARNRAGQALLLSVAEAMARATGNEAELRRIAELRWDLERASMLQQIRMLEQQAEILGISADQIQQLYDTWNSLPEDLPPALAGGGAVGGGFDGGSSGSSPLDEARRLLEQYQQAAALDGVSDGVRRLRQIESDFSQIFRALGRNRETLTAYHQAIDALTNSLLDPLRELQGQIQGAGPLSGATAGAQIDALRAQAQQLFDLYRTGTAEQRVQALEQLPQVLRDLYALAQSTYGGGPGTLALQQFILGILSQITSGRPGAQAPSTGSNPLASGTRTAGNVLLAGGAFLPSASTSSTAGGAGSGSLEAKIERLTASMDRLAGSIERQTANDATPELAEGMAAVGGELRALRTAGTLDSFRSTDRHPGQRNVR